MLKVPTIIYSNIIGLISSFLILFAIAIPEALISFNMLSMREGELKDGLQQWEASFIENVTDTKYPILIRITEGPDRIEVLWTGQRSRFDRGALETLSQTYLTHLEEVK